VAAEATIGSSNGGFVTDAPAFDPAAYKATTREQWQRAAEAWHRWGPTLEEWLGEATTAMLDATRVAAGSRVLDVAAGAGGQTIAAAHRAGPSGAVVATDISPNILEFAAAAAAAAGLSNVETRVADGEQPGAEPGAYDAVISRVGLIYFPDRQAALAAMRDALRPGGRIGAIVYSTPDRNEFFSIPVSIIRRRAQLPPPPPGAPGPFSLGAPGAIEKELERADFRDVVATRIEAPLRLPAVADYVRFARESFGALHQMLAGLPPDEQDDVWQEIARELSRFDGPSGFVGPCELVVAAGTR
jgi:SAM-dependent methyltransferase